MRGNVIFIHINRLKFPFGVSVRLVATGRIIDAILDHTRFILFEELLRWFDRGGEER